METYDVRNTYQWGKLYEYVCATQKGQFVFRVGRETYKQLMYGLFCTEEEIDSRGKSFNAVPVVIDNSIPEWKVAVDFSPYQTGTTAGEPNNGMFRDDDLVFGMDDNGNTCRPVRSDADDDTTPELEAACLEEVEKSATAFLDELSKPIHISDRFGVVTRHDDKEPEPEPGPPQYAIEFELANGRQSPDLKYRSTRWVLVQEFRNLEVHAGIDRIVISIGEGSIADFRAGSHQIANYETLRCFLTNDAVGPAAGKCSWVRVYKRNPVLDKWGGHHE